MASGYYRFEHFTLRPDDRQLCQQDQVVELNTRYFDALTLLLQAQGKLVSKEQFFNEVWRGVPVTDEALTQCIKTLRKQLGDSAARPRFIETVPKHGYRFIAESQWVSDKGVADEQVAETGLEAKRADDTAIGDQRVNNNTVAGSAFRHDQTGVPEQAMHANSDRRGQILALGIAGTAGGAVAGLTGGLLLGFVVSGSVSALLVMVCLCVGIAVLGAAGVAFGVATAVRVSGDSFYSDSIGGAVGGMVIGAAGQLVGVDAFNLLFGQSPGEITGAPEGFLMGTATGVAIWLCRGAGTIRRVCVTGALSGGIAGLLIMLSGGQLMSRSLHALALSFPESRLRLDAIGALFGESGFGTLSQLATGTLEGALFVLCVVLFMWVSNKQQNKGQFIFNPRADSHHD